MIKRFFIGMVSIIIACSCIVQGSENPTCKIIVLKGAARGVALQEVLLSAGEVKVFSQDDIITFILPFGLGQSGDLVQRSQRKDLIVVHCTKGELRVKIKRPDGTERSLPPVELAALSEYDIRVNVTSWNGDKQAFMISGYDEFRPDDGPVLDMFGGKIPLGEGDYAVTTEVIAHRAITKVRGEIPLMFREGLLLVEGTLEDGSSGHFIVDFGADGPLVSKDFVPAGAEIEKVIGIEYSDAGERTVEGTMQALGGDASGFLGDAAIGTLSFGELEFEDVRASVVNQLPQIGGLKTVGVLGLDLLRRTDIVSFGYGEEDVMTFEISSDRGGHADESAVVEIPFSMAARHIFIEGSINQEPVSLIFDTGARASIISDSIAQSAALKTSENEEREFQGLDDRPIQAHPVTIDSLRLGTWTAPQAKFYAADLPVLHSMGLQAKGGLLGNDFLKNYARVEVDFGRNVIVLVR